MRKEGVSGHTIDADSFQGGWVLDAGCRDFLFSQYAVNHGCKVIALDPDPEVENPDIPGVTFLRFAIAGTAGTQEFAMTDDVEARHIASANTDRRNCQYTSVTVTTIRALMESYGITKWDCCKFDIEGSEYEILRDWPGPIARQITVEWHDHVEKRPAEMYEHVFGHLSQWYDVVRLYAGDTLFVLKEYSGGMVTDEVMWWRTN